jgi:predicted permease
MLAHRTRMDRDLDEEMQFHLELIEKRQADLGASACRARAAARGRFGSPMRIKEDTYETLGWKWLEDLGQDLRYASRSLRRQKGFAATAILTLALGIGANAAIFSVVSGVVLRPLPFGQPDRLVRLHGSSPLTPRGDAVTNLNEFRRQSTSFDQLVGYEVSAAYLRDSGNTDRVMTVRAEREFFSMLGVPPLSGRTFRADDPANVAVVGEAFWRQRLRGDPSAIGAAITLDEQPFTVIGVMPDSFQFPYSAASLLAGVGSATRTDLWLPLELPARPGARMGNVTGRLKADVTMTAADSELAVIAKRLEAQFPETNAGRGVYLEPLSEAVVGTTVRRPLFVLFGAVAIVLVLACANVTNLSLVRMTLRGREIAVRSAIGAGRFRLVRQFLTESLLLALAGGAVGLAFAWWGTQQLMQIVRTQIPRAHEVGLDWRVFLFLLAVCAFTAAVAGLVPAAFAMRANTQAALQQSSGRTTMSAGQRRVRDGLVVAEVALALVLAVAATILVRELVRLRNTSTGMVTSNVVTFHLGHRMSPRTDVRRFYEIADRVAQLPGVQAAGFTQMVPLQNWGWTSNSDSFIRRGRPPLPPPVFPIELRYVTPGYFETLGIPIRGRGITERDSADTPRVILINEALARRYFGSDDPVGVEMNRGTIVGVVGDVRQVRIDSAASPEIYFPMAQNWSQRNELGMSLLVRVQSPSEGLNEAVRAAVLDVDPNLALFSIKTMDQVVVDSLSDFTLFLGLMVSFAGLSLLLAVTGTYGVISYMATSRVREFAIRLALGADRARVARLVLGQGVRLTVIGIIVGIAAAIAAAPLLESLPITVSPPDVLTTAPVAVFIGVVAVAACLVPALRAAGVSPMSMLRNE